MNRDVKMDLHGARTAADIERKYNFGKSFAEVMGIANGARDTASAAAEAVGKLDSNLTPDEIFNRLTDNGKAQGIFRDDDGQIYINAEYIVALAKLFAKDIEMTGKFTNTVEAYLAPGDEELEIMRAHVLGQIQIPDELIPLYDFSGVGGEIDGQITSIDLSAARKIQLGIRSMADWPGAKKTTVTMTIDMTNLEKAIRFSGTNMWGREVDGYLGVNFTSAKCPETEERIEALAERIAALEAAAGIGGE